MVYISIVSPGYFDRLVSVAEQVPSVLSTAAPMLKTVDNVHTVFHLGPRLSQSGFATVFLLRSYRKHAYYIHNEFKRSVE